MTQRKILIFLAFFLLRSALSAQQSGSSSGNLSDQLESALKSMDAASTKFRTTEASFEWIQFESALNDVVDSQKGKIYFRRAGSQIEMAADVSEPKPPKYVLFTEDKIELYETGINRVTVHSAAKNREEFEAFLVLGFGGSGHDMLKTFDVTFKGNERIGNVNADILDLVPKSEKVRNNVSRITLWIDPARGISIQQKMYEGSGYRLAKYTDIDINKNLPDAVFKLKTNGKTETITQ